MKPLLTIFSIAIFSISTGARGQNDQKNLTNPGTAAQTPDTAWQQCLKLTDDRTARLNCFDQWAAQHVSPPPSTLAPASASATAAYPTAPSTTPAPVNITVLVPAAATDCTSPQFSELSRYWELETGSDCGTFNMRGHHPISLSWVGSNRVNTRPTSISPANSAGEAEPYGRSEARIQLSVRTKIAQGLLTGSQGQVRDSLWFGYTQQSYWQLFNGGISRPFRSTDHEPELTYVYPTFAQLPLGWQLRYSGISLVHQSNGQSLPLSRSWNRAVLMAGMEKGNQYVLQARVWKRVTENVLNDDNPDISDFVGRAEVAGTWNVDKTNTLGVTLRHSLRSDPNGSLRLDWYRSLGDGGKFGGKSGLRFHTRLFTGFGDSLVDYNRQRTVLSIGLSLVDW